MVTSWWTTPFQSHRIHSITLFIVNQALKSFVVVRRAYPRSIFYEWYSCILPIFHRSWWFASEMSRFHCILVVCRWWKFDQSNFFALNHVVLKHRVSLRSQSFSNDSKLSHGWFLVHWAISWQLTCRSCSSSCKISSTFSGRLADQSEVDLWHQNFQNLNKPHLRPAFAYSIRAINFKFFCMFVLHFCLFCSKKASHRVFLQKFHSFSNQYNFSHDWWIL